MAFLVSPEVSSVHLSPVRVVSNRIIRTLPKFACSRSGKTTTVGVRVCLSIKDFEDVKILNLGNEVGLFGQLSAPVKVSTTPLSSRQTNDEEEEEKRNYYLNMGYAIRTIREEFPALFYKELSFNIYRDDIVFKDPLNTFAGIKNYKLIFWALRFHGRLLFRALWIDVISVWQPVDNMVMVRWTVHGIPRVPWESRGRFDGTSEYKLDKNGKIYEHKVHNIALYAPPKFKVLAVEGFLQSIGCPSTPKPTYFETSSSSSSMWKILPEVKFTGVGAYVSSLLTSVRGSEDVDLFDRS